MKKLQLDERYADETYKIRKANRHMYWAGVIMNLLIWPFLIIDPGLASDHIQAFPYIVITMGVIYIALGFYINYIKQGDVKKTRMTMTYSLLLIYIGGNMGSSNITVGMIGFGVAVASLMYGDVGVISKTVISIGTMILVKVSVLFAMFPPETQETKYVYIAELLLGHVLGFCTWSIGRLNYLFTASSRLALMKEKDEQKHILDQVLEIVETVQENSIDASELVAKLRDSSEHVSYRWKKSITEIKAPATAWNSRRR